MRASVVRIRSSALALTHCSYTEFREIYQKPQATAPAMMSAPTRMLRLRLVVGCMRRRFYAIPAHATAASAAASIA